MPSSPKIPKEVVLQNALELIKNEGYDALNIKKLAAKIGCSTQPISWHFKNMAGLRNQLAQYALDYANKKLSPSSENPLQAFEESGIAYITMACEEPKLFSFLYLNGSKGDIIGNIDALTSDEYHKVLLNNIAGYFDISLEDAAEYVQNTIIYSHGIASLIATSVISTTISEAMHLVNKTADRYLLSIGVPKDKIPKHKII